MLVLVLGFLGMQYVKPFPNYSLSQRIEQGRKTVGVLDHERQQPERIDKLRRAQSGNRTFYELVKAYTHGIIVEDRPHVSPEFQFGLSATNSIGFVVSFF